MIYCSANAILLKLTFASRRLVRNATSAPRAIACNIISNPSRSKTNGVGSSIFWVLKTHPFIYYEDSSLISFILKRCQRGHNTPWMKTINFIAWFKVLSNAQTQKWTAYHNWTSTFSIFNFLKKFQFFPKKKSIFLQQKCSYSVTIF